MLEKLTKVELNDDRSFIKIRMNDSWKTIILNPKLLYEAILELLFDKVNLLYYTTQRKSCNTLKKAKKDARRSIANGTINFTISSILSNLGWEYDTLNINNTVFQGDLCEYLMCILLDEFTDSENMICKVSLKTSSRVSAFGNDNIFYNYKTKILYYGEAKFYQEVDAALEKAFSSLDIHSTGELKFICNHTTEFIAKDGRKLKRIVKKFENVKIEEIRIGRIIFIMNEDVHLKEDYEHFLNCKKDLIENDDIIAFVPILSKEKFLEYFKENLRNYV